MVLHRSAVVIFDHNNRLLFADSPLTEITGLDQRQLIGMRHEELIQRIRGQTAEATGASSSRPMRIAEEPLRGSDGARLGLRLTLLALQPNECLAAPQESFHRIIGGSPVMRALFELVQLVARTDVTVHISGESGVGKELVADALHELSPRRGQRFVKLTCSSIPSTLLESSLFGHVRGSFTGANRDHAGFAEYADGGTLFLDEIGDISHEIQLKLLRLLETGEYFRVGDSQVRRANLRVITATNRDLKQLVAEGKMREDFFFRINIFPLHVPALRERLEDIPLLCGHFIARLNRRLNRNIAGVSEEALQCLMRYPWPGNVRELENAIEHAFVIVREGLIDTEHLPVDLGGAPVQSVEAHGLNEAGRPSHDERSRVIAALENARGNRTEAAKLLGCSRVTLWKKLHKLGLVQYLR